MDTLKFDSHSKTSDFKKFKDLIYKKYAKFIDIKKIRLILHQIEWI